MLWRTMLCALAPVGRAAVRHVLRALAPPRRPATALLAACALLGAGAAPQAQAQAADPDKLFGTTSQSTGGQVRLGEGNFIAVAQPFITGSQGGGYRVVDAMIRINAAVNRSNLHLRISIRDGTGAGTAPPDAVLHELTLVDSDEGVVDPNRLNRFQAPEAAWLLPDTRYWLVFECVEGPCGEDDGETHVDLRVVPSVLDTDGLSGWSLPGSALVQDKTDLQWSGLAGSPVLQMTLNGFAHSGPYIVTDGVEVTSAGLGIDGGDHYAIGDTIELTVTFNVNVAVKSGTTPGIRFKIGAKERTATYARGSGSKKLRFEYTFTARDPNVDGATGIRIGDHSETWTGAAGNITNTAGTKDASLLHPAPGFQAGHGFAPVVRPTVTGMSFVSSPRGPDAYGAGETIEVAVDFSEPVIVTTGVRASLEVGTETRTMRYLRGTETGVVSGTGFEVEDAVFGYVVVAADADDDDVPANAPAKAGNPARGQLGPHWIHLEDGLGRLHLDTAAAAGGAGHTVDGSYRADADARLGSLRIGSPALVPPFDPDVTAYAADAGDEGIVTVTAEPVFASAAFEIAPLDARVGTAGHHLLRRHHQRRRYGRILRRRDRVGRGGRRQGRGMEHRGHPVHEGLGRHRLAVPHRGGQDRHPGHRRRPPPARRPDVARPVAGRDRRCAHRPRARAVRRRRRRVHRPGRPRRRPGHAGRGRDRRQRDARHRRRQRPGDAGRGRPGARPGRQRPHRDGDRGGRRRRRGLHRHRRSGAAARRVPHPERLVRDDDGGARRARHGHGAGATSATLTIPTTEDTTAESDETFTVTLSSPSSNAELGTAKTATGTIVDDDTAGVTVSKTALTVTEEDATGDSYTMVLNTQPTANVTVTVAGHLNTGVTPNPATLTFTPMNWATAQTVTVTAGNDADTANDSVSLTHSATSTDADYQGIMIAGVAVTVTEAVNAPATGAPKIADARGRRIRGVGRVGRRRLRPGPGYAAGDIGARGAVVGRNFLGRGGRSVVAAEHGGAGRCRGDVCARAAGGGGGGLRVGAAWRDRHAVGRRRADRGGSRCAHGVSVRAGARPGRRARAGGGGVAPRARKWRRGAG